MHYSDRDQFPWTPYSLGRKLEDVRFLFRPASWSHARVRPARSRGWNVGPPMRGFAKKKTVHNFERPSGMEGSRALTFFSNGSWKNSSLYAYSEQQILW